MTSNKSKVVAPNLLLFSLLGQLLCSPRSGVSRPIVKHRIFYQAPSYLRVGIRSDAKTSRPSACTASPPLGFFKVDVKHNFTLFELLSPHDITIYAFITKSPNP